ncbi:MULTISPECIES: RNA polymerase sigma factor [unclassified Aminobacter]|uniref:RNA polymerase sigma factor n=1 Tax=unclassified Aminobacter TaxID=2644704 RepID=UPI0004661EA2|nr:MULTISPECIES: RNA polymerase sigma factor [unclassified Aminobacter]TWH28257.1 RNA polymerase sigma-70 factor (ECF subfamily) [Aminobacter sp. J15]
MEEIEDANLVLARNGDRSAFARLVEMHYEMFFRVAHRHLGNRADAEDVAQEVCVRLGRSIRTFRGECSLASWLYRLVINAACDHQRKAMRGRQLSEAVSAEHTISAGQNSDGDDEAADRLWEAVRMLPDKTRQAVVLVYSEGLSHLKAAEALECSETTVSWHIHDAKKKLRVLLAEPESATYAR